MKSITSKKYFFSKLIIVLILFSGCKKLDIEKELRIDLGTQFQNDMVIIKLDNTVIFSDSVSTNNLLGFAEILILKYPIGKYKISVNVNGNEKTDNFRHKTNRFVYISYDKITSQVLIKYPDEKYVYD
jgi:hypothetical protein